MRKSQASSIFNNVRVRPSNKNKEPYSCLYAINIGKLIKPDYRKGIDRHETGWLMDARRAVPSHFIRPHAQHGLLFKPFFHAFSNASPRFVVFRFKKSDAEKWIGNGAIFKHRSIYPPIRYIHPINRQQEADSGLCQLERSFKKTRRREDQHRKLHKRRSSRSFFRFDQLHLLTERFRCLS